MVYGYVGELVLGYFQGVLVVCMKGCGYFYEGCGMIIMIDVICIFKLLGCELLFCINVVGLLCSEVGVGSLVVLKDYINIMFGMLMVGFNDDCFGECFFLLVNVYDVEYCVLL